MKQLFFIFLSCSISLHGAKLAQEEIEQLSPHEKAAIGLEVAHKLLDEYLQNPSENQHELKQNFKDLQEGYCKMALRFLLEKRSCDCVTEDYPLSDIDHLDLSIFTFRTKMWHSIIKDPLLNLARYTPYTMKTKKATQLTPEELDYFLPIIEVHYKKQIEQLDLSSNKLDKVPQCLGSLKSLKSVDLRNNPLKNLSGLAGLKKINVNLEFDVSMEEFVALAQSVV